MKEDQRFGEFVAKCKKYNVPHDVPFLYPEEAMFHLRCKRNTLYKLMNSGKLRYAKEAGEKQRKFRPEWIIKYLEARLGIAPEE